MYDLIIIGAGPAGLGASIYASRYKIKHLVIGAEIGGQITKAWQIENYPGFESISGQELTERFKKQATALGGEIISATVENIDNVPGGFAVFIGEDKKYECKSIIFALGMNPRKLDIENEEKFIGRGISYCAICDAMFFKNKDVAVIGGGDSAATASLHLAEFANSVRLLYKEGTKCFEPAWEEKIKSNEKIKEESFSEIEKILGDEKVSGLSYTTKNGEKKEIETQGIFIEIGSAPGVVVAKELGVKTDEHDYIIVKSDQSTNLEYVYAAGDVTTGSNKFRQIATAVAEGAVAAGSVYKKMKLTENKS